MHWIPAYAGMTNSGLFRISLVISNGPTPATGIGFSSVGADVHGLSDLPQPFALGMNLRRELGG